MEEEVKRKIKSALQSFVGGNLTENGLKLFETLGYVTQRKASLSKPTFVEFKKAFAKGQKFDEGKGRASEWTYVDLLFQLTKEEVSKQTSLFDTKKIDNTIIEAYLFFAIDLQGSDYSRTDLSLITREVNKLFPMPVMVLFKYDNKLTLAVINRRLHKRDDSKDVLEKVTLIKDINSIEPHRAHIEILFDLSFDKLKEKYQFTNFVELHIAWQRTLDTKELNKRFFNELANWYFWASSKVTFPDDAVKDKDVRNATGVIRLITRLMFAWFLKEKSLISEDIFDETKVRQLLKFEDHNKSTYYKAILQNLFFATLNTEMGKRKFRGVSDKSQSSHYFIHNLFRYEKEFIKPKETLEKYFAPIPFLNGGLFECLDKQVEINGKLKAIRIDGFSDRVDNVLKVPDELFFSEKGKTVDLSKIYGSPKRNKEKVRGLINILSSYKFTIAENTPIEEEVALDPELLGKVFENLLANYNPETKTTARKQTGSFYTPREIVNYMVDESLLAYLKQQTTGDGGTFETKLRDLLSYSDTPQLFNKKETESLIQAIDNIKIIDPACGSGAFPMGILHKLVHVLHKLDPRNELWRQRQIDKAANIDDITSREAAIEAIEEAFENNELDYGRKLYLIENCIYGADIQPIAVQIAKLRFFISLIVEQRTNSKRENLGVRPLPNLETKFVAANTLIKLEKENAHLFTNPEIDKKKEQLKKVRHEYFEARSPRKKENCRNKDKQLRDELAQLLIANHDLQPITAKKIVAWNPYDQNSYASFFDTEWMFGLREGFDIVIGNPPYVQLQKDGGNLAKQFEKSNYKTFERTGDIYSLFYERGFEILKAKGHLIFITSNKWMRAGYGESTREFFHKETNPILLIDFSGQKIFEEATVDTNILLFSKEKNKKKTTACIVKEEVLNNLSVFVRQHGTTNQFISKESWVILSPIEKTIKEKIERYGVPLMNWEISINYGIKTGCNEAFIINAEKRKELINQDPKSEEIIRPILCGEDIKRYGYEYANSWLINSHNGVKKNGVKRVDINDYPAIKEHLDNYFPVLAKRADKGDTPYNLRNCAYMDDFNRQKIVWGNLNLKASYCIAEEGIYINAPSPMIVPADKYLLAVLNSKLGDHYIRNLGVTRSGGYFEYKPMFIEKLPIPILTEPQKATFIELVEKVIAAKSKNKSSMNIESQIDALVYELYNLSGEEIAFIEAWSK